MGIPILVITIVLSVYFYRRARKLQQIDEDPVQQDAKLDENSLDILNLKENHSIKSNSPVKPDFSPEKLMEQSEVINYDPDHHDTNPCPDSAAATLGSAFAEALHFDTSPKKPTETVTRIKRTREGSSREGSTKNLEFLDEEPQSKQPMRVEHDIEEIKLRERPPTSENKREKASILIEKRLDQVDHDIEEIKYFQDIHPQQPQQEEQISEAESAFNEFADFTPANLQTL